MALLRMLRLWRRGETLQHALRTLHAIEEDPDVGRAERDDMIPTFEGRDRTSPARSGTT